MPNVTFAGVTYACDVAVKGYNYIELQDAEGVALQRFEDISDFDAFTNDGDWTDPAPVPSTTATEAVLTDGNIVLTLRPDHFAGTGTMVKFNAPCDCTAVTGGLVIGGTTYTVVTTMGEVATGTGGAWCAGAQVAVLLDCANARAFMQGGGGGAPAEHTHAASDITAGTFAGMVQASASGQDPDTACLRNSKFVTVETTPDTEGPIYWVLK